MFRLHGKTLLHESSDSSVRTDIDVLPLPPLCRARKYFWVHAGLYVDAEHNQEHHNQHDDDDHHDDDRVPSPAAHPTAAASANAQETGDWQGETTALHCSWMSLNRVKEILHSSQSHSFNV